MHLYGKILRIPNDFSTGASKPMLLKFYLVPPWGREMEDCKNGCRPLTKMAAMPIYGKNL